MKAGIHVGGPKVTAASVKATADAIVAILGAGYEYGADQKTIRHALDALKTAVPQPGNLSLHGATVIGSDRRHGKASLGKAVPLGGKP